MTRGVATYSPSWSWWTQVLLRGAGFPATGVLELADPDLGRQAEVAARSDVDSDNWTRYQATFANTCTAMTARMQQIAKSEKFRCAVAWQNRRFLDTALRPLLRFRPGVDRRGSKHRQHEEALALYWQRYCVKNDSIGFFGPVGWGRLDPEAVTSVSSGRGLIAETNVFFEPWAIARVASVLEGLPGMRDWLKPRRVPFVGVRGGMALPPTGSPVPLSPMESAVLAVCDGTVRARDVPAAVTAMIQRDSGDVAAGEADVFASMELMHKRRWLTWNLELPVSPRPERDLRIFIAGIGDLELRASCLEKLDKLTSALETTKLAPGHDQLVGALSLLDKEFTEITGSPATRHDGRVYGGRTLAYIDCRRATEFTIGSDIWTELVPAELLTTSARWFSWQLAQRVRQTLNDVHCRIGDGREEPVDLATLCFKSARPLHECIDRALLELRYEFLQRWRAILGPPRETNRVAYGYQDLLGMVEKAFNAPEPGWPGARYMSPDILLCGRSPTVGTGPVGVLGEMHAAINTLRHYCFVMQHPRPADLFACMDVDWPEPRSYPVLPKESPPRLTIRTHSALVRDSDFLIAHTSYAVDAGRYRTAMSSDVRVVRSGDSLQIVLPAGERFDILDIFAEQLMNAVIDRVGLCGDEPHSPRITFGRLVVSRETWRLGASDLVFAKEIDEAKRFALAIQWRSRIGLPRHVFVKALSDEKPFYVDFYSPVYISILARAIRRSQKTDGTITFVEMLPAFEELWLHDNEGHKYTSELRFSAFDIVNASG